MYINLSCYMLYIHTYKFICQLFLNKAGGKRHVGKKAASIFSLLRHFAASLIFSVVCFHFFFISPLHSFLLFPTFCFLYA